MTPMETLRAWVQEWRDEAQARREQAFRDQPEGENHKAAWEAAMVSAYDDVLMQIDRPIEHTPRVPS